MEVETTPMLLVIDDDATLRMLVRESLQSTEWQILEAENGSAGLDKFEHLNPDVVMLDVLMPDIDGFEVCTKIRRHLGGTHVPILVTTGLNDIESINKAYDAGATDFITKPINWTLLEHRLRYIYRVSTLVTKLHKNEVCLSTAQRIARLGSWEWDPDQDIVICSRETQRILGISSADCALGYRALLEAVHPDELEEVKRLFRRAAKYHSSFNTEHRVRAIGGRVVRHCAEVINSENGNGYTVLGTVQDITTQRQVESKIRYLAYYDTLTGLANRTLFKDELRKATRQGVERSSAVLFVDLDDFKRVNDSHGHEVGDEVLREFAQRLQHCLRGNRDTTTVARLAGDEFAILLTNLTSAEVAALVATRIRDIVANPFYVNRIKVFISVSIGISLCPENGDTFDALIKHADMAMYHAKSLGKNNYQFYTKSMSVAALRRLKLESWLRGALEKDEFELYYPTFRAKRI